MSVTGYVDYNSNSNSSNDAVTYFSLKGDGDEAIVRFLVDNPSDMFVVSTHKEDPTNGPDAWKSRSVSCLRESPSDDVSKCPMCAAEYPINRRLYIKMLLYSKDSSGEIVATPKIWERPIGFGRTIVNNLDEMGPLSDCIYKVKRNGTKTDTTYDMMYCNPNKYPESIYKKDTSLFDGFDIKTKIFTVTFDKMQEIVNNFKNTTDGVEVADSEEKITWSPDEKNLDTNSFLSNVSPDDSENSLPFPEANTPVNNSRKFF